MSRAVSAANHQAQKTVLWQWCHRIDDRLPLSIVVVTASPAAVVVAAAA